MQIVYLEDGGSTFLQNVCHHLLADTILYSTRQYKTDTLLGR